MLGSTGIIGRLTLQIVDRHPDRFEVIALTAGRNIDRLAQQIEKYKPALAVTAEEEGKVALRRRLAPGAACQLAVGAEGLIEAAGRADVDLVVVAVVGFAGLAPVLAALKADKDVALANKECLVAAGGLVTAAARNGKGALLPVDSEHSAVYQCLMGHNRSELKRILLTASGGACRDMSLDEMSRVAPEQALAHPNWTMGRKITIDSATLMNKGLEAIEAMWLFDLPPEQVQVVIHHQSIIHSAVEYSDGTVIAQMSQPDMRSPIAFALGFPERIDNGVAPLDLFRTGQLTFAEPDFERFPCLALAFRAAEMGRGAPTALNAADEVAVSAYLDGQITLTDIALIIKQILDAHQPLEPDDLDAVVALDARTRKAADAIVQSLPPLKKVQS